MSFNPFCDSTIFSFMKALVVCLLSEGKTIFMGEFGADVKIFKAAKMKAGGRAEKGFVVNW